jgi:glycerol-3-phosphate dehydrogenase (NAD(P)+)
MDNHISVIGAGAWGTALAIILNRTGAKVTLWARDPALVAAIDEKRINTRYLNDIFIDPAIFVTSNLEDVRKSRSLVLAVPAQTIRSMCITLANIIDVDVDIIVAAKGIERGSQALMSHIVQALLPRNPLAILSGPNFADEAARALPTATVLASRDEGVRERLQLSISNKCFRPYTSDDIVSVQVGGAVKNIIALACGMADGAGLGENARAALITRGLVEMQRLAEVLGGNPETLYGLAGMGDMILSCTSLRSRNMEYGYKFGKKSVEHDASDLPSSRLTEGVMTAEAVYDLSIKHGVRMPICTMVARILEKTIPLSQGIDELLSRPTGTE